MKSASVIIGVLLILGVGAEVYISHQRDLVPVQNPLINPDIGNINPEGSPAAPDGASPYTLAQVAAHHTPSNCWSAINGSVYDLTSWIPNHPGGPQAIEMLCGIDGSNLFNGQHGGDRRVASILAGFKLGSLTN